MIKKNANDIKFQKIQLVQFIKKSFVYDFLSSIRQKINDPARTKNE